MDSAEADDVLDGGAGEVTPVLLLTPTGRDAAVAVACLQAAGIPTRICHTIEEVCAAMDGAAAALLADEALPVPALAVLHAALQQQPVWSDFPVLLLTGSPQATEALWQRVQELDALGNVTVLERPLTRGTLLSTVQVALRSRRRQRELRQMQAAQRQHLTAQAATLAQLQARDQALRHLNETLEQQVMIRTAALSQALTARLRLEREAQRAEHFALLGRLAAGVSHELRNPLGAVFLNVDLLDEELRELLPNGAAGLAESLADIKANLARVEDLVEDYLSLVRVGTMERTVQDLGAALQGWAAEFQALAAARGITLRAEGLADLGWVACHANTLRRALLNLVQNGLEAMAPGDTLTLRGQRTATQVQLEVQDTGGGIPADRLRQIFEPLHTTKPGGTGLGLYIVQEVVHAHGGQVAVASVEGQGATFTLTLPQTVSPLV